MAGRFYTPFKGRKSSNSFFRIVVFLTWAVYSAGMDLVKHVVMPMRQVAQRTSIRGFIEDYYHIDADVVVLAGETHLYRKPVGIWTHLLFYR